MSSLSSSSELILLVSSDKMTFEVEESVAKQSQTIKHKIGGDHAKSKIPVPIVTGFILAKVVEYIKKHADAKADEEGLKLFDAEFVKALDTPILLDLVSAADYLDIKGLLDLTCQTLADKIKYESPCREPARKTHRPLRKF